MSNDYVVDVFTDQPRKCPIIHLDVCLESMVFIILYVQQTQDVLLYQKWHIKAGSNIDITKRNGVGQIRTVVNFLSTIKPRTAAVIVTVH